MLRKILLGLVPPVLLLFVWAYATRSGWTILPTLGQIGRVLIHPFEQPLYLDSPSLFDCTVISLFRVLIGFSLAVLTAVPLGLLAGRNRTARQTLMPTVELVRSICPVAWLPLAIVLFGFSSIGSLLWQEEAWRREWLGQLQLAMIVIIWWGAFFPILLSSIHGVERVRKVYLEAARTLGAKGGKLFREVVLPSALPTILSGMRVGLGISWMVIIAAEIFPGSRSGLGYMITTAHQAAQYEYAFAAVAVIGVLGFGMNSLLEMVSRKIGHWQAQEK
jgi:NitT/TauT family transport system permease protein